LQATEIPGRYQLFSVPARDDHVVSALIVPGLVATRRLAPRSHRMTAARGLAFAAAVWMVNRIHDHAAVVRTLA
jgi:hypothetical protein